MIHFLKSTLMALKANIDVLIEKLKAEGRVHEIPGEEWDAIMTKMEQDLKDFDRKEKKRRFESARSLHNIVLNV